MKKWLFFFLLYTCSAFADLPSILPPPLKSGDLVAIVFPASFVDVSDEEAKKLLIKKAQWLQTQGYRTIFYPEQVDRKGYLAGTDAQRGEALMNAWKNSDVKAIWCFRGGYGTSRILDYLDYEVIKANPKMFIGMSDITALHHAIQQKTGLVTFLAPLLKYFDDPAEHFDDEYALSSFNHLLAAQTPQEVSMPPEFDMKVISPGVAQGKLIGGNLSLIAALCGTKWQLNTEGRVLILEDVSESVQKVDRLLWQLKQSGLLDKPAAVVLASWADCDPDYQYSLTFEQVFEHYFKEASYPVVDGFPSGHIEHQLSLPLNTLAEIDTYAKAIRILEPAVTRD